MNQLLRCVSRRQVPPSINHRPDGKFISAAVPRSRAISKSSLIETRSRSPYVPFDAFAVLACSAATIAFGAVSVYSLYHSFFNDLIEWPKELRNDMRAGLAARKSGDLQTAALHLHKAWVIAKKLPYDSFGTEPLLRLSDLAIIWMDVLEAFDKPLLAWTVFHELTSHVDVRASLETRPEGCLSVRERARLLALIAHEIWVCTTYDETARAKSLEKLYSYATRLRPPKPESVEEQRQAEPRNAHEALIAGRLGLPWWSRMDDLDSYLLFFQARIHRADDQRPGEALLSAISFLRLSLYSDLRADTCVEKTVPKAPTTNQDTNQHLFFTCDEVKYSYHKAGRISQLYEFALACSCISEALAHTKRTHSNHRAVEHLNSWIHLAEAFLNGGNRLALYPTAYLRDQNFGRHQDDMVIKCLARKAKVLELMGRSIETEHLYRLLLLPQRVYYPNLAPLCLHPTTFATLRLTRPHLSPYRGSEGDPLSYEEVRALERMLNKAKRALFKLMQWQQGMLQSMAEESKKDADVNAGNAAVAGGQATDHRDIREEKPDVDHESNPTGGASIGAPKPPEVP